MIIFNHFFQMMEKNKLDYTLIRLLYLVIKRLDLASLMPVCSKNPFNNQTSDDN